MPTNAVATGFWTSETRNNARQGRALIQAIFGNNDATPMNGTRSGVVTTAGLTTMSDLLVFNVSGLSMSVAPGTGIAHRGGQGPYAGWLLATATVTCDPAPASNPRNDIIIMRFYDAAVGDTVPGGGANVCQIEIVTGTPGAIPVDPVTPNSLGVITSGFGSGGGVAIPLARAQVSTGGAITLTDIRRSTSIPGTVRVLLPGDSDTAGRVGDFRYNSSTDVLEILGNSGSWRKIRSGVDVGGEWRANAVQSLTNGGAVRLSFPTAVVAGNGITFNGTNTWTIGSDGVYSIYAQARKSIAAAQDALHITGTTYSDATLILPGTSTTGYGDVHVSGSVYLTAGTQVCAWYYSGSATANTVNTRYPMFKIWKQQAAA